MTCKAIGGRGPTDFRSGLRKKTSKNVNKKGWPFNMMSTPVNVHLTME